MVGVKELKARVKYRRLSGEIIEPAEPDPIEFSACRGDFDTDGDCDGTDLSKFASEFGRTDCAFNCKGDFNCDGDVDGSDLAIFASKFGRTDCQ